MYERIQNQFAAPQSIKAICERLLIDNNFAVKLRKIGGL